MLGNSEAGEDIEDVLASKLRKLRTLASDIDYEALHTAADKYLQQLYEVLAPMRTSVSTLFLGRHRCAGCRLERRKHVRKILRRSG